MVIIGIDPGSRRIGYGILEKQGGSLRLLKTGTLRVKSHEDAEALGETRREFSHLLTLFKPKVLAIEKLYFAKNKKTALQVAQARGVILGEAAERGLRIEEYTPNEIKAGVAGYGLADKKAVAKMVHIILGEKGGLKVVDDATDALAAAILAAGRVVDKRES